MRLNSSIKTRDAKLAGRIQHLILEFTPSKPLDGLCFHLNFSDTTYDQEEFARILFGALPLFALRPDEYEQYQLDSPSELQREAYNRLTKNKHMSDYGEVLLFLILDYFFDTPKFVTKVRARTSESVAVFGSDCAHISFNQDGSPILWLGESKFKEDFSGAVGDAVDSVKKLITAQALKSELRLLDPHVETNSGFDSDFLKRIKDITCGTVPIGSFDVNVPVLLLTNSGAAASATSLEDLRSRLEKECHSRMEAISKKDWPVMNRVKFHFILFPLRDKPELVKLLKAFAA